MKKIRLIPFVGLMLLTLGCEDRAPDRVPAENTAAFYELHGVVNDGKRFNEITLINDRNKNRPKLRFPPNVPVSVYTPDTHNPNPRIIKKCFAYEAKITLELNAQKRLIPIVRSHDHLVYDEVAIRFRSSLQNSKAVDARLLDLLRRSPPAVDRVEWGLREYTPMVGNSLQSYDYIPLDENLKSIDGGRIWIQCDVGGAKVSGNQGPAECSGRFDYKNELSVVYVFRASLMPYWREIYSEAIRFSGYVLVN